MGIKQLTLTFDDAAFEARGENVLLHDHLQQMERAMLFVVDTYARPEHRKKMWFFAGDQAGLDATVLETQQTRLERTALEHIELASGYVNKSACLMTPSEAYRAWVGNYDTHTFLRETLARQERDNALEKKVLEEELGNSGLDDTSKELLRHYLLRVHRASISGLRTYYALRAADAFTGAYAEGHVRCFYRYKSTDRGLVYGCRWGESPDDFRELTIG